jgi:hypothetical protein
MNQRLPRIKKSIITNNFFVIFISLTPLFIVSMLIVGLEFRDNENYASAFRSINTSDSIINNFQKYSFYTGAIEPFLFFYYLVTRIFTESYTIATGLKNILFVFQVSYIASHLFKKNQTFYLFLIYISTDFYLLRMMAELHRLHFSILFIIPVLFLNRKIILWIPLSVFSHAQAIIYFLFLKFQIKSVISLIVLLIILLATQYEYIFMKLSYYQTLSIYGALKVALYSMLFMAIIQRWSVANIAKFGFAYLTIGLISLFIGEERLFFIVVESSIAFGFYRLINAGMNVPQATGFAALVLIISLYNLSRIIQFTQNAISAA